MAGLGGKECDRHSESTASNSASNHGRNTTTSGSAGLNLLPPAACRTASEPAMALLAALRPCSQARGGCGCRIVGSGRRVGLQRYPVGQRGAGFVLSHSFDFIHISVRRLSGPPMAGFARRAAAGRRGFTSKLAYGRSARPIQGKALGRARCSPRRLDQPLGGGARLRGDLGAGQHARDLLAPPLGAQARRRGSPPACPCPAHPW